MIAQCGHLAREPEDLPAAISGLVPSWEGCRSCLLQFRAEHRL